MEQSLTGAVKADPAAGPRLRIRIIDLEWPVTIDGREYRQVVVRRLTAKEVADHLDALARMGESGDLPLPIFRDEQDNPLPRDVLDKMDDDDQLALEAVANDFLPRRFRGEPAKDSAQPTGDITAR